MKIKNPIAKLSANKIIATPMTDKGEILTSIYYMRIEKIMLSVKQTEVQKSIVRKYLMIKSWDQASIAKNYSKYKSRIEKYAKNN